MHRHFEVPFLPFTWTEANSCELKIRGNKNSAVPRKNVISRKGKVIFKSVLGGDIFIFPGNAFTFGTSQLPTNQQKTFPPRRISNLSWLSEPFYLSSSTFLPGVGKVIESRWYMVIRPSKQINGHGWLAVYWFLYQPNTAIFDSKSRITWHTHSPLAVDSTTRTYSHFPTEKLQVFGIATRPASFSFLWSSGSAAFRFGVEGSWVWVRSEMRSSLKFSPGFEIIRPY